MVGIIDSGPLGSALNVDMFSKIMKMVEAHPALSMALRGLGLLGKFLSPFEPLLDTIGDTVDAAMISSASEGIKKVGDWVADEETQTALKNIGVALGSISAAFADYLPLISGGLSLLSTPTVTRAIESIGDAISLIAQAAELFIHPPKTEEERKADWAKFLDDFSKAPWIVMMRDWLDPLGSGES